MHTNYGGILQAAALYRVLAKDLQHEVVFLERGQRKWPTSVVHRTLIGSLKRLPWLPVLRNQLAASVDGKSPALNVMPASVKRKLLKKADIALRDRRIETHQAFLKRFLPNRTGHLGSTQDLAAAAQRFGLDALVVGSDQVWRLDYFPSNAEEDYFFGYAPTADIRKISYSASFGHGTWTFPEHTARTRELIAQFHAVSVREASGVEICATVFDRHDAQHVLDPTLLVDPAFYEEIAGARSRPSKKTFLSYVLDEGPDRQGFTRDVRAALGSQYAYRSLTLDTGSKTIDIPEWIRAFMDADFVLTDSFHGMVFSIIFEKKFLAIVNRNRGADRFVSLLEQLDLRDRLVTDAQAPNITELVQQPIDYQRVKSKLKDLQTMSAAFLRKALD
ncbi:polysaccharide pyruvyl transferase family protein [Pseudorhodoferax sp. Leaf267]|uniref:polysaccharide pyruvyl transferase family protein n=1 Tax=Pseudorhodoferax sp. Leaf267 TaxID=1736316 RepID=UPI00138F4EA8|nr:polysaccharide pyruvyl transferase family protein [Pseudorhodoferax sp. Leaf267]